MGNNRLRIALIAGSLDIGGAEKQLVYITRSLHNSGADVRIYHLVQGEYYESELTNMGIPLFWIGRHGNPLFRLMDLRSKVKDWYPHLIQSTHFYTNLYAAGVAPITGGISIGSIRNDTVHELKANRFWGSLLLRSPYGLISNSTTGQRNAVLRGIDPKKIQVLPNVIDLYEFDRRLRNLNNADHSSTQVSFVVLTRLVHQKRVDRFLSMLARARLHNKNIIGRVIGDGPEYQSLIAHAKKLDLFPDGIEFLGARKDIPEILSRSDVLVSTSDHEGFPNAILEGMAACLPVITTPAGDAGEIVKDQITGNVIPFEQTDQISDHMVRLAASKYLRKQLGEAGRRRVEQFYSFENLHNNLYSIYTHFAKNQGDYSLLNIIELGYANAG